MPKRRRIRLSQNVKESSKEAEEVSTLVINVEISRERTQLYTRKSRTPSPKDSVPKKDPPLVTPHTEQHDDIPSSHEAHEEQGESKEAENHPDTEGEEFQEGELFSAEAKMESVLQYPFVTYEDSPIRSEDSQPPLRDEMLVRIPSPVHEEK